MNPLSVASAIGSLCGVTAKLIFNISEFIDAANPAPREVQSLNNELAALYSSLGHIKIAVQSPRVTAIPDSWSDALKKLVDECSNTLGEVQKLVDKSKTTETAGTARKIVRTVKFAFNQTAFEKLKQRISSQLLLQQNLLSTLWETRGDQIEKRLKDIHDQINELLSSRVDVKELLIVLEEEDELAEETDFTPTNRASRHWPHNSSEPGRGVDTAPFEVLPTPNSLPKSKFTSPSLVRNVFTKFIAEAATLDGKLFHDKDYFPRLVHALTKPSADTKQALDMIANRRWMLEKYIRRPMNTSKYGEDIRSGPKGGPHRLTLRPTTYCLKMKSNLEPEMQLHGNYSLRGRTIIGQPPACMATRWHVIEMTLSTVEDAQELHFCLTNLTTWFHFLRKTRVVLENHLPPSFDVHNQLELDMAAAQRLNGKD